METSRMRVSNTVKRACAARVERTKKQSAYYANAAKAARGILQIAISGTGNTDTDGIGPDGEHSNGYHQDASGASFQYGNSFDSAGTHKKGTYTGASGADENHGNNKTKPNGTCLICASLNNDNDGSCTGACRDGTCPVPSSPNHSCKNGTQWNNMYSTGAVTKAPNAAFESLIGTVANRHSPFVNVSISLGNGGQPKGVTEHPFRGPITGAYDAARAGKRRRVWRPAKPGRSTTPPKHRNLDGGWRQRERAPEMSFRDGVLADLAAEPKQPTLLEKLGPSEPDPEPWQLELCRRKGKCLAAPDYDRLRDGLLQELYKKYGDTWPRHDGRDGVRAL